MLGKSEGKKRRERQRMRWLDTITNQWTWTWANSGRQRRTEERGVGARVRWVAKSQTRLTDWTTKTTIRYFYSYWDPCLQDEEIEQQKMDSVARVGQIAELAFRPSLVDSQAQAPNPHSIPSHHQKARTTPDSRGGFSKPLAKKIIACIGVFSS